MQTCTVCGGQRPCTAEHEYKQPVGGESAEWSELGDIIATELGVPDANAETLLAEVRRRLSDRAEAERRERTRIRESYLAAVRANMNLLASMTAEERDDVKSLAKKQSECFVWSADDHAKRHARLLMVETYGASAVDAALGDVK